jgi:hypothetical protein
MRNWQCLYLGIMGLCSINLGRLLLKISGLAFLHHGQLLTAFKTTLGLALIVVQSDFLALRGCRSVRSTEVRLLGRTTLLKDVATFVLPFTFGH